MDTAQLLQDIKQLLQAEISQSEQRLKEELRIDLRDIESRLSLKIEEVKSEMREGLAGIGDIIAEHNDVLENDDSRLTKLEVKIA